MNILMLTTAYPAAPGDGRGMFVHQLARRLVQRGHGVTLVAPRLRPGSRLREDYEGVRVRRVACMPPGAFTFDQLRRSSPFTLSILATYLIGTFFASLRAVRRDRIHLIHAHWELPGGLVAVLVGALTRLPVVVSVRGISENWSWHHPLVGPLVRWTFRRTRCILAVAENLHDIVGEFGFGDRVLLVQRGVELDHFRPLPRDASLARCLGLEGRRVVLYVGDFIPRKGVRELVEAAALLGRDFPDLALLLVGDGPLEGELRAAAAPLAIPVVFAGRVKPADLPAYYSLAAAVAVPSHLEFGATVTIEAMACRRPVVATETEGRGPVLRRRETALLVRPRDPRDLARGLAEVLRDPALAERLAGSGNRYAVEEHSWDREVERTLEGYRRALGRQAAGPVGTVSAVRVQRR